MRIIRTRRGRAGLVLALLAAIGAVGSHPTEARPMATRRECRAACDTLIGLCQDAGARRRYCRRSILRRCRRTGLAFCDLSQVTTTTTVPYSDTTTTTLDPGPTVNGCNRSMAEDHRGETLVQVRFDLFDYAPECVRVSPGTTVRFSGQFSGCPLAGGSDFVGDPTSPFMPPTTSGYSKDFVLDDAGIFGYFCDWPLAFLFRTWGAVIVEP